MLKVIRLEQVVTSRLRIRAGNNVGPLSHGTTKTSALSKFSKLVTRLTIIADVIKNVATLSLSIDHNRFKSYEIGPKLSLH